MALDLDGRILAIRAKALHNLGAYIVGAALVPLVYSLKLIPNVYNVPTVDLTTQGVFTHTAPTNPYRGAGRPEAVYVTERLLDLAAEELGIDPVEIRRRNFIDKAALPYRSATGLVYDSGDFNAAAEACLSLSDWDGFDERSRISRAAGKLRGRSIVSYIEDTGVFNDRMELRFDPSGAVTIVAGTFSHGQSHATTYSQCVSDWLGIPMEQIRLIQGDTDQVAFGRGTYASGSAIIGGNALRGAADEIIEKAKVIAGFCSRPAPTIWSFGMAIFVSWAPIARSIFRTSPNGLIIRRACQSTCVPDWRQGRISPPNPRGFPTAVTSARWKSISRPARSPSTGIPRSTTSAGLSIR